MSHCQASQGSKAASIARSADGPSPRGLHTPPITEQSSRPERNEPLPAGSSPPTWRLAPLSPLRALNSRGLEAAMYMQTRASPNLQPEEGGAEAAVLHAKPECVCVWGALMSAGSRGWTDRRRRRTGDAGRFRPGKAGPRAPPGGTAVPKATGRRLTACSERGGRRHPDARAARRGRPRLRFKPRGR